MREEREFQAQPGQTARRSVPAGPGPTVTDRATGRAPGRLTPGAARALQATVGNTVVARMVAKEARARRRVRARHFRRRSALPCRRAGPREAGQSTVALAGRRHTGNR